MKATIDIDGDLYSRLEAEAKSRGCNMRDLVTEAVQRLLTVETPSTAPKTRIRLPIVDSGQPGKLNIPDDIMSRLDIQEDIERHEASLR